MIQIFQSSLGIQVHFYNKTLNTEMSETRQQEYEADYLKRVKGDLNFVESMQRVFNPGPQAMLQAKNKARQHWTWIPWGRGQRQGAGASHLEKMCKVVVS